MHSSSQYHSQLVHETEGEQVTSEFPNKKKFHELINILKMFARYKLDPQLDWSLVYMVLKFC